MKKSTLLTFVVAIALMGAGCKDRIGSNTTSTPITAAAEGRVIFSVTDVAAKMNEITAVNLTIDKIEMHSASRGWITVIEDTKEFELLALKAKNALSLLGRASVEEGAYNQIRVHVRRVSVIKSGAESPAKLPSNTLEINGRFTVNRNSTTSVSLDFVADESLHEATNGEFVFAPVVKLESRTRADVSIKSDNTVVVSGGVVEEDSSVGMDLNGMMKENFKLDAKSKLQVKGDIIELAATSSAKVKVEAKI